MSTQKLKEQFQGVAVRTRYRNGEESPGYIRLVDVMGDETRIAQAARTSYAKGTKTLREDAKLIRYLFTHRHTTPFEMVNLTLEVHLPIFVARQWMRHRTASYNEMSLRYSEPQEIFHLDPVFSTQSQSNRQGSGADLSPEVSSQLAELVKDHVDASYSVYRSLTSLGVSREQARAVLGVGEYTRFFVNVNLHNLLHWMTLRSDSHAQYEVREFARIVEAYVETGFPTVYEAWCDTFRDSITLRGDEIRILSGDAEAINKASKREVEELNAKLQRLGESGIEVRLKSG